MLNTQRYILTLLSAIFVISSGCQKSDLIGLDVDNAIKTDTITTSVEVSTVKEDSIITNGSAQHAFGYINDPVLGTTEANLALSFNLPNTSFSFGTTPIIDSVVLALQYGKEFYGDSTLTSRFAIQAYELDTTIGNESYYLNKTWKHKTDTLGTKSVRTFSWGDSVRVVQVVDGILDTPKTVQPHLRIQLDKAKLSTLLLGAGSTDLATNASFRRYLKGIYLTINKANSTGTGGITFFDLLSSTNLSGLQVYYRNTTSAGAADTNMVLFPTTSSIAASNVKHVHNASVVLKENDSNVSEVYVQALGGYRTKIKLNDLTINQLKALIPTTAGQKKTVSINRAELVIPEVGTSSSIFKPSPRLALYRTDIAGVRKPVPDNAIGTDSRYLPESIFGGFYNTSKRRYVFVVTSYIQDLLNGTLKEFNTYIAPIRKNLTGTANINASGITATRAILPGKNHPTEKIKLNIIYTRPD